MARKPMVTRAFKTMNVNVLCMDVTAGECYNTFINLPRVIEDPKKLLKAVQEAYDTEEHKAVHIVETKVVEKVFGMSESDFIKYSVELDENRKPIADFMPTPTNED